MRKLLIGVATGAAALSFAAPATAARPPIADWPLGFTCLMGMNRATVPGGEQTYEFQTKAGPLAPVTDSGEAVSDVAITCTIDVTPAAHPAAHLKSVGESYGGVVAGPLDARVVTTGEDFTVTQCSRLTWVDANGAPRTGGSCHTKTY